MLQVSAWFFSCVVWLTRRIVNFGRRIVGLQLFLAAIKLFSTTMISNVTLLAIYARLQSLRTSPLLVKKLLSSIVGGYKLRIYYAFENCVEGCRVKSSIQISRSLQLNYGFRHMIVRALQPSMVLYHVIIMGC